MVATGCTHRGQRPASGNAHLSGDSSPGVSREGNAIEMKIRSIGSEGRDQPGLTIMLMFQGNRDLDIVLGEGGKDHVLPARATLAVSSNTQQAMA